MKYYQCSDCHEIREDLKRPCVLYIDQNVNNFPPNLCPKGFIPKVHWSEITEKEYIQSVYEIVNKALQRLEVHK